VASTVAQVYNEGLGAKPPVGSRGPKSSLKLKHFRFLNVQWKPQICPLFKNLERQKNQKFVLALQEIMGGHKTGGPGAKLGGPGLKPPLVR